MEVLSKQLKVNFCNVIAFFSCLAKAILVFQMCFIRRTIAYLCLNMINFHAVDFSECRSEEVMFLFDTQCIRDTDRSSSKHLLPSIAFHLTILVKIRALKISEDNLPQSSTQSYNNNLKTVFSTDIEKIYE